MSWRVMVRRPVDTHDGVMHPGRAVIDDEHVDPEHPHDAALIAAGTLVKVDEGQQSSDGTSGAESAEDSSSSTPKPGARRRRTPDADPKDDQ